MTDTTNLSLLERAQMSRDDDAWRQLLQLYGDFVESYLRHCGIRDADIEDLRQDTLTVVIQELDQFDHNGRRGAFRTWLRQVMVNRLRAFRRSPANRPVAHPAQAADDEPGCAHYGNLANQLADEDSELGRAWDQEHNRHLINELLRMAAGRFSEKTLRAFRATFLEEQSIDQVSKNLEMSLNAVVIARSRVLKSLREMGEGLID